MVCCRPPKPRSAVEIQNALNGVAVLFAGADTQRAFDGDDEDFAIANASGLGSGGNRFDHAGGERIVHDDLQLHLGQKVDDIFGTTIEFGMALLTVIPETPTS